MIVIKNIKKEVEEMKRLIVVALALLLAVPAISYAGSASSRWDVMIGGYIKAELAYSDQMRANQWALPLREGKGGFEVAGDEYGNWDMTGVQTRFNFTIKGPDVWGMKTMGFIEGDFYGNGGTGTYNSQGNFRLRHAFIKLMEKNYEITIAGNTTQVFGTPTGQGQLLHTLYDWISPGLSIGAGRVPQINIEYFTPDKKWSFLFGLFMNTNTVGTNYATGRMDNWTWSETPSVHGRIMYSTDKCGKIGNDKLTILVDGFYGTEKEIWDAQTGGLFAPGGATSTLSTGRTGWNDDDVDSWGVHASFFVPIIPEKKGNKTGAVGFSMYGWIAQNPGFIGPGNPFPGSYGVYYRFAGADPAANTLYGWAPQFYVYATDKFMIDLFYSTIESKQSRRYKTVTAGINTVEKVTQYGIILNYDPNPALKFTLSWDRNEADYSRRVPTMSSDGKANTFKFCAFYFF